MIFNKTIKYILCVLALFATFFGIDNKCFAANQNKKIPTVAVLSDSGHRNGTTYIICGAASDIIAEDIINELNKTGRIKAPLLGETMSNITQRNIPLYYLTFFREYKNNYNIDFVNLKRVTQNINADYILMVTSGMDIQSHFLKTTWWNKLGLAEGDPIVPTYKLSTLITLIDKKTYSIVWQDMYLRDLKADDYDLGITQFSPSYPQLAKIKKYSATMSQYVTREIDKKVNPSLHPKEEPKAIEMKSKFLNEGTKLYYPSVNGEVVKQNFNDAKNNYNTKREKRRLEKEQKKHIENVRLLEQKRQAEEIKQLEQSISQPTKTKNKVKQQKEETQLFDTINNNIDDISNSLPPEKEQKVTPAVQIQPAIKKQEPKVLTPIMNKPPQNNTKPSVYYSKPENKQNQKKELPKYDWNLKNINLQQIGKV